jgi:putative aminopeptidase FrvX
LDGSALLERLVAIAGVSGAEAAVAAAVRQAWEPLCDQVVTDALGNVVGLLRADPPPAAGAEAPTLMLAAHTDEIGMVVTKIEPGGFLRLAAIGGVDRRYLPALAVLVHGREILPGLVGTLPPHLTTPESRGKPLPLDEAYVDVGLPEARVRERVSVGDRVTVDRGMGRLLGEVAYAKAMDDRASVAALHEALLRLRARRRAIQVAFVATVQEEVGLRGATTAGYGLAPDLAVAVDVGHARSPGLSEPEASELGKGPVVAQGANFHPSIVRGLLDAAKAEGIPHQREYIAAASGTDAWAIQVARAGVPCGLLSLPLRYMHSPVETLDLKDVRETGRLLAAFAAWAEPAWVRGLSRVLK